MKIHIKNMVCRRCLMAVEDLLRQAGYTVKEVHLGEAIIEENLSADDLQQLNLKLKHLGFELLDSYKGGIVNQIKTLIIDLVHHQTQPIKTNLSDYLTARIPYEYNYLSNTFSELESNTVEKFYIQQKIEKAKELLTYDELTLSQIAHQLGYSSVAHLSNQFKRLTGLTPGHFKAIGSQKRHRIEDL